jgi:cysteine desulfurase
MIYLDANATTPLAPEVLAAMLPFLSEVYGNPSSGHRAGRLSRAAIDESRDALASLLKCRPHEIIFTGSGTESDNLAILGLARAHRHKGRHLITCATEHHAVLHAFDYLEQKEGFSVTKLGVGADGRLDPADLSAAIGADTTIVSIMTANNETGVTHPVSEISAVCRKNGVLFHSDVVQSFGKETLDISLFDALSLAAHKFYGPKGAGALFLRGGIAINSIQLGGAQESQRRPGTENTACIVGLASAAQLAMERMADDAARIAPLRDRFEAELASGCHGLQFNGHRERRLFNTANVTFPASDAESILMALDLEGVCASSGSACMVGSLEPSHVLQAMGVPSTRAASSLRFSFGRSATLEEVDTAVAKIRRVWERLSQ